MFLKTRNEKKFLWINSKKAKMKKIYSIKCNKYRKFRRPKIYYIINKALVFSMICDKCGSIYEKIFKEKE